MLFKQYFSRVITTATLCTILTSSLPAFAQGNNNKAGDLPGAERNEPRLVASVIACTTCGAQLDSLVLEETDKSTKNQSVLTDSLWGNLILELAYQRDLQLAKIAKKSRLMGLGTAGAIGGIAGGTLAQGISALYVLNPKPGRKDSYAPLILGTALSSATLMVFASRVAISNKIARETSDRQRTIKKQVEKILAHMELAGAKCEAAEEELTALIGGRASKEWVDLYQSSHQVAMSTPRRFSMLGEPAPLASVSASNLERATHALQN